MKVIVADKISERGVELLKKTPGLKVVVTTKDTIGDELCRCGRSDRTQRHARYAGFARQGAAPSRGRPRGRRSGQHRFAGSDATRRARDEHSGRQCYQRSRNIRSLCYLRSQDRSRKLDSALREGRWEKSSSGTEVRGKTLGLIGLGRIGSEVASRAEAFDMRVVAYDPYISEAGGEGASGRAGSAGQAIRRKPISFRFIPR